MGPIIKRIAALYKTVALVFMNSVVLFLLGIFVLYINVSENLYFLYLCSTGLLVIYFTLNFSKLAEKFILFGFEIPSEFRNLYKHNANLKCKMVVNQARSKRSVSGSKYKSSSRKRKYEMGRLPTLTKLGKLR